MDRKDLRWFKSADGHGTFKTARPKEPPDTQEPPNPVQGFIFGERGSRRFNEPRTGCRAVQVPFSEPRTANRLEANRGSRTVKRTGSEVRLRTAQSPGKYTYRSLLLRVLVEVQKKGRDRETQKVAGDEVTRSKSSPDPVNKTVYGTKTPCVPFFRRGLTGCSGGL